MSKTVYAVSAGSYSDYHVCALFTTRQKAEEFMGAVRNGDYNDIEIYELDPPAAKLIAAGNAVWCVLMLRDGTVEECEHKEPSAYTVEGAGGSRLWRRSQAPYYKGTDNQDVLVASPWAKDKKHAIKIANERRVQMIANGEWK